MSENRVIGSVSIPDRAFARPDNGRCGWSGFMLIVALGVAMTTNNVVAGPRIIEMQFQSSKLATLVAQRLAQETPCYNGEFELPFLTGTYVLDHVEFPGGITVQRSGQVIQLVVPMEIYTKTPECLRDPNCGLTSYEPPFPLSVDLVFDITGEAKADSNNNLQPFMCIRFSGVQFGGQPIPAGVAPGLEAALQSLALNKCNRIQINAVQKLLAGEPKIKAVGANANSALDRIALRIEFEDPGNPTAPNDPSWISFLDGVIKPSAPNSEWSLFIDQSLFKESVVSRFASKLAGEDGVEIVSGPSAVWTALGENGGRVDVALGADFDVEICSIGADADIRVAFSASAGDPNVVHADGTLDIDIDGVDVFACSLLTGPAFPFIFSSIATVLSAISVESLLLGSSGTLPDECTQQGETGFACDFPANLPRISMSKWNFPGSPGATMSMTQFFGHRDGPILGGPMPTSAIPGRSPLNIQTTGFSYGVKGGCSSLSLGWKCALLVEGTGRLCRSIQVLNDPLGVFAVQWLGVHHLGSNYLGVPGQNANVVFPAPGGDFSAYYANPYPCDLLIRTSLGSQTIRIPGPDVNNVNQGEAIGELSQAQADCLIEVGFIPGVFNPLWLVDPPPWEIQAQVLYEDPDLQPENVTAQVTSISMISMEPVTGSYNQAGQVAVSNAPMQMQVGVVVQLPSFSIGGRTKHAHATAQSKPPGDASFTLTAPVSVDLLGSMSDGGLKAEVTLRDKFSRILDAAQDDLPPGLRSASFQIDVDPADATFGGPLKETDLPAVQPLPTSGCGAGACGAGSPVAVPFLMLGAWFSKRRTRRRR